MLNEDVNNLITFACSSLKEFSSAFRTNTEFEVAVPCSFSAKHWYCPKSSSRGEVMTRVPRPGCCDIRSSYACQLNSFPFLIHRYLEKAKWKLFIMVKCKYKVVRLCFMGIVHQVTF